MGQAIRFGLIGYGAWGRHHAKAIRECTDASLVAIAARSKPTQAEAAKEYKDAVICASYAELLARDDVDVVDVVLPNDLHFEVGRAVLESGKHLLLEKPMALTVADCQTLNRLAADKGKSIAVGFELRLSSLWRRIKTLIAEGAIGEPLYGLIELFRRPYRPGSDGWRYDIRRVGNWILEEPIHFFDLARWYFADAGHPVSVYARANSKQSDHPELRDNFSAILNFESGPYVVISQTLSAFEHHQTVKITGTRGALWAQWDGAMDRDTAPQFSLKLFDGENVKEIALESPSGEVFELAAEIAAFAKALQEGKAPVATGIDGAWAVNLCLAGQQSVESGQPVTIAAL